MPTQPSNSSVPSKPLPAQPNLEFDRKHAKALLKSVRAADAGAIARVRASHPRYSKPATGLADFTLADAQLVIAREYGFASWAKLKVHLEEKDAAPEVFGKFKALVDAADAKELQKLLSNHPELEGV